MEGWLDGWKDEWMDGVTVNFMCQPNRITGIWLNIISWCVRERFQKRLAFESGAFVV